MTRARRLLPWLCIALALALAGCAHPGPAGAGSADTGSAGAEQPGALTQVPAGSAAVGSPADAARLVQAALARAAGFPAQRSPRPLVVLEELPTPGKGFKTDAAKIAHGCRRIALPATAVPAAPATARVRWPDGRTARYPGGSLAAVQGWVEQQEQAVTDPPCRSVAPLRVTGVRLGTAPVRTDRGTAELTAWLLSAPDALAELAYPAIAPAALWRAPPSAGGLVEFASASRDGRSLTLRFPGAEAGSGPCSASYRGFVAASPAAVAVAVAEERPQRAPATDGTGTGCRAIAFTRTVTVVLDAPLGDRLVVDAGGRPVPVCPPAAPVRSPGMTC